MTRMRSFDNPWIRAEYEDALTAMVLRVFRPEFDHETGDITGWRYLPGNYPVSAATVRDYIYQVIPDGDEWRRLRWLHYRIHEYTRLHIPLANTMNPRYYKLLNEDRIAKHRQEKAGN